MSGSAISSAMELTRFSASSGWPPASTVWRLSWSALQGATGRVSQNSL